uniref:Sema domain-containing protein n=1 Tax=Timema bartmani TaxID=61472 RepID=A0A7R9I0U5_9NEOP|nr:unnamed protein product [Timema bartmani]
MQTQSNLTHLPRHEFVAGVGLGIAKCPYDPADNSTALWVEHGNPGDLPGLYSGTNAEFTKADTVIFRKTTLSSPDRDSNLDLPVLGGLAQHDWRCRFVQCFKVRRYFRQMSPRRARRPAVPTPSYRNASPTPLHIRAAIKTIKKVSAVKHPLALPGGGGEHHFIF